MKYALYTGCVAKGAGRELLTATLLACEKLGIELAEMTDAACCGAGVIGEDNPLWSARLAARVWLPKAARAWPVPAILEYIPYRKRDFMRERDEPMHRYFAGRTIEETADPMSIRATT